MDSLILQPLLRIFAGSATAWIQPRAAGAGAGAGVCAARQSSRPGGGAIDFYLRSRRHDAMRAHPAGRGAAPPRPGLAAGPGGRHHDQPKGPVPNLLQLRRARNSMGSVYRAAVVPGQLAACTTPANWYTYGRVVI